MSHLFLISAVYTNYLKALCKYYTIKIFICILKSVPHFLGNAFFILLQVVNRAVY